MADPAPSSLSDLFADDLTFSQFLNFLVGDVLLPSDFEYPSETLVLEGVQFLFFTFGEFPGLAPVEKD